MRVANLAGRSALIVDGLAIDVHGASEGRFGPDPQSLFADWDSFLAWAQTADLPPGAPFAVARLRSPVPAPPQVLAIGLNYREHAAETGFDVSDNQLTVFTKFASCITGPDCEITLPAGGSTDWEVELVAVIGRRAWQVPADRALSHVAGYAVGQDISERRLQMAASPPQFSLGKSLPGFGPIGPWLVTLDELTDPNDLELGCSINDEQVQLGRTRDLILSVPRLISTLSQTLPLLPGDVIFTGTPPGVGLGRDPQRYLRPGEVLVSHIEGIGQLRHRFVAGVGA